MGLKNSRLRKIFHDGSNFATGIDIDNPALPFSQQITDGIPVDAEILVRGRLLSVNGFTIVLSCADNNIAFHVQSRSVILSSFVEGHWVNRQLHFFENEINLGDMFMLRVLHQSHCFTIFIRSLASRTWEICDLQHRVDPDHISYIELDGDVHLNTIHFIGLHGHITENSEKQKLLKRANTVR